MLVYLWLRESFADVATKLLAADPEWLAPLLWRSEFRNVVVGALRRKTISIHTAFVAIQGAERQMAGHEQMVDSRAVLRLAMRSRCSAYDCEYVALAEETGVPLVTNDSQILKDFPSIARPFLSRSSPA